MDCVSICVNIIIIIYYTESYHTRYTQQKKVQAIEQNKQKLHSGQQLYKVLNFKISPTGKE